MVDRVEHKVGWPKRPKTSCGVLRAAAGSGTDRLKPRLPVPGKASDCSVS